MDNSYQGGCNCAGGPNKCECQDGYTCCSQKGNEQFYGLCVKKEAGCNKDTGFAKKSLGSRKIDIIEFEQSGNFEGFANYENGGWGCPCGCSQRGCGCLYKRRKKELKTKLLIAVLILIILILVGMNVISA